MPVKFSAPVGDGVGVQKFSIKPSGIGLSLESSVPAATPAAPVAPESAPSIPESVKPPTPFQRLYPGVDPAKVEMVFDDQTRKVRFKPIESPPEVPDQSETQSPAPPIVAGAAPDDPIAQLKAELQQRDQLMTAMVQSAVSGRPLMEILSGAPPAPAEPDYSNLDLYDDAQRTQFIRQMRADMLATTKAEVAAQMAGHLPSIQNAQRAGERAAVAAKFSADPNFQQKAELTDRLIGNNPNISFEATYNLVSLVQSGLTPAPAVKPAAPNGNPTLTQAQADAKAAQAARYPASQGGRANGAPTPPAEALKDFKTLAKWVSQQQDLGNIP